MAYASTVTTKKHTISGRRHWFITISETGAGSSSEWSITDLPVLGTIVHYEAHITAGSGTTLQPKLGKVTGFTASTDSHIYTMADARSAINSDSAIKYDLVGATDYQKIFGCSQVNSGSDNSITTRLVIMEGHDAPIGLQDSAGSVLVSLGTKIAGEDITNDRLKVEAQYSSTYISTATTTTAKSGAGFLHAITIGETAAGAITIYDNTAGSGTVLAVLKASIAEQTFIFNCTFSTGLTIVTAGASKLTVSYR